MKKILSNQYIPIIALLAIGLTIGLLTIKDYGESWDEDYIYHYSGYAIDAYQFIFHPQDLKGFPGNINFYGTSYFIMVNILGRFFVTLIPSWSSITAWHFVYFLTFLTAVLVTYLFVKRWMSQWVAFGTALLLLAQPLLWGHAFINPKDTPFMTFFMTSIYLGFCMVDSPIRSFQRVALIFLSGIVLGLTISFRVIGPLAGFFVLVYAAVKGKQKLISFIVFYLLIAVLTSYLTWPFLWKAPLANYIESLTTMTQFPFTMNVLFRSRLYEPNQLPRYFFPTMFGIQLTEPLLIFFAAGVIIMAISLSRKEKVEPILLFLCWFLLPAIAIIMSANTLYDNARQLYFLLPPVFFAAAFTLDFVFKHVTSSGARIVFLMIAVLPGLYPAIRLHPYEYIYYNSFVRGTGGAYRQFEMDYWGISFKEATEYINAVAPHGARILVFGPDQIAKQYARPDLQILTQEEDNTPHNNYDYAIILTRKNQDERRCTRTEIIYTVGRRGSVFTVVKKLNPEDLCR